MPLDFIHDIVKENNRNPTQFVTQIIQTPSLRWSAKDLVPATAAV